MREVTELTEKLKRNLFILATVVGVAAILVVAVAVAYWFTLRFP